LKNKAAAERYELPTAYRLPVGEVTGMRQLTCQYCGETFAAVRRDAKYCSRRCREAAWDVKNRDVKARNDALYRKRHPERIRAMRRRQYAKDLEKSRAKARANYYKYKDHPWSEERKDHKRESDKKYRAEHSEQIAIYLRQWSEDNPKAVRAIQQRRRAKRSSLEARAQGDATAEQLDARMAYYGYKCWVCGGPFEAVDHVKPLNKGGSNWPANLRPACTHCNCSKKDTWPFAAAS